MGHPHPSPSGYRTGQPKLTSARSMRVMPAGIAGLFLDSISNPIWQRHHEECTPLLVKGVNSSDPTPSGSRTGGTAPQPRLLCCISKDPSRCIQFGTDPRCGDPHKLFYAGLCPTPRSLLRHDSGVRCRHSACEPILAAQKKASPATTWC